MTTYPQNLPAANAPVVGANGLVTPAWLAFFQTLLNRTGGASGGGSGVVIDNTSSATTTGVNGLVSAYDDANAQSQGVAVGKFYRNGSVLQIRIA